MFAKLHVLYSWFTGWFSSRKLWHHGDAVGDVVLHWLRQRLQLSWRGRWLPYRCWAFKIYHLDKSLPWKYIRTCLMWSWNVGWKRSTSRTSHNFIYYNFPLNLYTNSYKLIVLYRISWWFSSRTAAGSQLRFAARSLWWSFKRATVPATSLWRLGAVDGSDTDVVSQTFKKRVLLTQ